MMRHLGITMNVTCDRKTVLERLRHNRERHLALVTEARIAYVARAKAALAEKLDLLAAGKVTRLVFGLNVPLDYTDVYNVAIEMLEHHQSDTIELAADEFRHLMRDKWEWTEEFIKTNAAYSEGTRVLGAGLGIEP